MTSMCVVKYFGLCAIEIPNNLHSIQNLLDLYPCTSGSLTKNECASAGGVRQLKTGETSHSFQCEPVFSASSFQCEQFWVQETFLRRRFVREMFFSRRVIHKPN
jgi:hypothetical protein